MHRLGFIERNIRAQVRRSDFVSYPVLRVTANLENAVIEAAKLLSNPFNITGDLAYGVVAGKSVMRSTSYESLLALRLINSSILRISKPSFADRQLIVKALTSVISEQVKFKVYKLDVRRFFESFNGEYIFGALKRKSNIPVAVKDIVRAVVTKNILDGHAGLPRGLVISSSLSDMLMEEFDQKVIDDSRVFFYRRYVDDLTLITGANEQDSEFVPSIESLLPPGLCFKKKKKEIVSLNSCRPKENAHGKKTTYLSFEYLGYSFNVASGEHNFNGEKNRHVWLDIAPSKVSKIKTRILKAYLDYIKNKKFDLLEKRIKHLTSNISLRDRGKGITRLSGIHFSYPLVDIEMSIALKELDNFFLNSLFSTSSKIFRRFNSHISTSQRSRLASYSFFYGAKNKRFYQLNLVDLAQVQRCWKYG
ncbi:antiviral reverse transcriptase Drt3a [Xanthomonas arboricola]|uniref:antiviral reverse transcriptase Drt3a n=1 Tax=Xanthomonas arboricola TaxID=56448 RepID=UPI002888FD34|nr:antiviral reverse transcriptase Drt3a [Xanthomonas arboricola]